MGDITEKPKMTQYEARRNNIELSLTEEEIDNFLEDYVQVRDPITIPLDSHVRYFTIHIQNGRASKVFRLGGRLNSISPDGDYLILKAGRNIMQVPVKNTIFYKQITLAELKDEYEDMLDSYEEEIMKLKKRNKKLLLTISDKDESIKGGRFARMNKIKTVSESVSAFNTHSIVKHDSDSDEEKKSNMSIESRVSRMSTSNRSRTVPPSKREIMMGMQVRL